MISIKIFKWLIFLTLLMLSIPSQAAMVSFGQSNYSIKKGDQFTISIQGLFSPLETIEGGGLNLLFNPNLLNVNTVKINSTLFNFYSAPGTVNNINGNISNMVFNTFAGASGNFNIVDITFTALNSGISNLTLSESLLNPFSSLAAGSSLNVILNNALVNVAPVPLPGTFLLMLSSLIFLSFFRRRNH